ATRPHHLNLHKSLLPAPDHGLALAGPLHDRRCPQAIGGEQDDPAAPDVLLRAVAIGHYRFQAGAVGGVDGNSHSLAHSRDSHTRESPGIPANLRMANAEGRLRASGGYRPHGQHSATPPYPAIDAPALQRIRYVPVLIRTT